MNLQTKINDLNAGTPRWIMSAPDLSGTGASTAYCIDDDTNITLAKRWQRMIETLRQGPVFCASPVRLSDAVFVLRSQYGVEIDTLQTDDGRKYYSLACDVREVR
ncbi:MAG: hypothetical protein AAGF20_13120 [Pseudomonadota bacterium]